MMLLSVGACERKYSGREMPLRPLVYTELPPSEDEEGEEAVLEITDVAPEDLGYALFEAIVSRDRASYERLFVSGAEWAALVRLPADKAEAESARILARSELLWELFTSDLPSEDPLAGVGTRLSLSEFRLGKGRNLAGKTATGEHDEAVQHWGNELRLLLQNNERPFVIRLPKIVNTMHGWRIAAPVELDQGLQMYLEAGMHLKDAMLASQYYPFPIEVGNYWKYDVQSLQREAEPSDLELELAESVTDLITEVRHRDGYWIVRFERSSNVEGVEPRYVSWLVTARRIYLCDRDCRYQIDNIAYILNYMLRKTPIYVFPMHEKLAWATAGKPGQRNRYEVQTLPEGGVHTPSGIYSSGYTIAGSVEEGREERSFVPGTGVVMRTLRTGAGIKRETMTRYRLIL
jgi:hypothetical protein